MPTSFFLHLCLVVVAVSATTTNYLKLPATNATTCSACCITGTCDTGVKCCSDFVGGQYRCCPEGYTCCGDYCCPESQSCNVCGSQCCYQMTDTCLFSGGCPAPPSIPTATPNYSSPVIPIVVAVVVSVVVVSFITIVAIVVVNKRRKTAHPAGRPVPARPPVSIPLATITRHPVPASSGPGMILPTEKIITPAPLAPPPPYAQPALVSMPMPMMPMMGMPTAPPAPGMNTTISFEMQPMAMVPQQPMAMLAPATIISGIPNMGPGAPRNNDYAANVPMYMPAAPAPDAGSMPMYMPSATATAGPPAYGNMPTL
ncbi:hypothetical protein PAPYR_10047 [Paratrimastix pyriformis]|uniref:Uncharacterized protein n=1 Tax=Paratrimastix pyriformis TaxID=342808 RepID=A0ABQ8UBR4_9EUKA|nr:hypothetical protein PAPYR_10047 [Paratrimastix pyriformis]|eukprot:GAFH01002297.1.p1 GENE.GAFH01002297.1~~GAFH01002297.1.p1  ORF type:complete len:314 (-),score=42.62 GAFH01002297.1:233-1174(-)